MFLSGKRLPRRTFLRSAGVTIALPLLDAMIPAGKADTPSGAPTLRVAYLYFPHGAVMSNWTPPASNGPGFTFSRSLLPLAAHHERIVVLSGLANKPADAEGPDDRGGDHARAVAAWLTGVHPRRTEGKDVRAAMSADQLAAAKFDARTPLSSLQVACENSGPCDMGYSCTYLNTLCWRTPETPLPMEINPRNVFATLFGTAPSPQRSVLDAVTPEIRRLNGILGTGDGSRLKNYLESVREVERRVAGGVPASYDEHVRVMFELLALAWQADITRFSTFMMAREMTARTFPNLGINDPFHALSHHGNDPAKLEKLTKINVYYVSLLAGFLDRLAKISEPDGTLADNSLIVFGSGISDSNLHSHGPLPVVLAGGAAGQLKGNRHLRYPDGTPWSNLLLTVLEKSGVYLDQFGDSTKKLVEV